MNMQYFWANATRENSGSDITMVRYFMRYQNLSVKINIINNDNEKQYLWM